MGSAIAIAKEGDRLRQDEGKGLYAPQGAGNRDEKDSRKWRMIFEKERRRDKNRRKVGGTRCGICCVWKDFTNRGGEVYQGKMSLVGWFEERIEKVQHSEQMVGGKTGNKSLGALRARLLGSSLSDRL